MQTQDRKASKEGVEGWQLSADFSALSWLDGYAVTVRQL